MKGSKLHFPSLGPDFVPHFDYLSQYGQCLYRKRSPISKENARARARARARTRTPQIFYIVIYSHACRSEQTQSVVLVAAASHPQPTQAGRNESELIWLQGCCASLSLLQQYRRRTGS